MNKFGGLKSKNYAFIYASDYYNYLNNGDNAKLVRCIGTTRTTVKDNININSIISTLKDSSLFKMIIIVIDQKT